MIARNFWWILGAIALLAAASAPGWTGPYGMDIITTTLLYIGLAAAWNVVGGMAGQFSLAHNLFVAAGSTVVAALIVTHGWSLVPAFLAGIGCSVIIALAISALLFRRAIPQLSFALVTLAFGEIGLLLITSSEAVGAASGVVWNKGMGISSGTGFLYAALVMAVVVTLLCWWIRNSRLGFYMRAVRDDESAAAAIGINLFRTKTIAMVISAVMTTVVATLYASYVVFVNPHFFGSPVTSIIIILYVVVGGLGTVKGPILGALLLFPLDEFARAELGDMPGISNIILALAILLVVLYSPKGLAGLIDGLVDKLKPAAKPIDSK